MLEEVRELLADSRQEAAQLAEQRQQLQQRAQQDTELYQQQLHTLQHKDQQLVDAVSQSAAVDVVRFCEVSEGTRFRKRLCRLVLQATRLVVGFHAIPKFIGR